ncbi:MAG: hypothetical protein JNG90_02290 [Planctomycetaceae bacterium]|nr:hypothetical protein [Planctomycetaceae bacterium]
MSEKDLNRAAMAGVFAEFLDPLGNVVAQEVFFDWQERPVPDVGDVVTCAPPRTSTNRPRAISGKVRIRHYEVQRDEQGEPRVWVRLVLDVCSSQRLQAPARPREYCSLN